MATRRMISTNVITSAKFLKMPAETQALYFHLCLNADDDGVCEGFSIMKLIGSSEDNIRILNMKGFVKILNEDLVTYIMDWNEHNFLRADRKIDSVYQELLLQVLPDIELMESRPRADRKKNMGLGYTGTSSGRPVDGVGEDRLGQVREGQDSSGYTDPDGEHTPLSKTADSNLKSLGEVVYSHWNTKKIVVHDALYDDAKLYLSKRLKEFNVDQILLAIDNYAAVVHHKDTYFNTKWTLAEFLKREGGMRVFLYKSPADYAEFGKTIVIHNWTSKSYIISLLDKLADATKGLSVGDHYDGLRKILDEHGLAARDVYCFNLVRSNYRDWKSGVSAAKPDIPLSRIVYDWETLKIARKPGRAFSDNNGSLTCETLDKEGFIYKLFIDDAGDTRQC